MSRLNESRDDFSRRFREQVRRGEPQTLRDALDEEDRKRRRRSDPYAYGTISGNTITAAQISAGTITTSKIAAHTIRV